MSRQLVAHLQLFILAATLAYCGCSSPQEPSDDHDPSGGESGTVASGGNSQVATGGTGGMQPGDATGGASMTGGNGAGGTSNSGGMNSGGASSGGSNSDGSGGLPNFSTTRDDFGLGAPSLCSESLALCENFETTSVGSIPSAFTLAGYGNRTVGTVESQSARGNRSLQIDIPGDQNAVVAMLRRSNLGQLGEAHFGRVFYRIEGPGPSEFIHFDVLEAVGPWMGHENAVRFASTGTGTGTGSSNWSWIYNVQPMGAGSGNEFGSEGDRSAHPKVNEWMCLEWEFNASEQTATYYHDGTIIDYLVIDTERSEIPVIAEIGIGLQKFQKTSALRVWIDEFALNPSRIGCNF